MATHTLGRQRRPAVRHPALETLLSFVLRPLYRKVEIEANKLSELCDTVQRHSLHSAISRLYVRPGHMRLEPDWNQHADQLLHFFRSTTQITLLHTSSLPNLASLLFSPKFASVCLPNVKKWTLDFKQVDLVSLCRFRRLYTELEDLVLSVWFTQEGEEPAWVKQESKFDQGVLPPDQVTSLTLIDRLISSNTPRFFATFSAIQRFSISVLDHCDLSEILKSLSTHVRKLEIGSGPPSPPVDALILQYRELELLKLDGDIYTEDLLPKLHQLPQLASLSLEQDPHVTLDSVRLLLSGPTKIRSLKKLELFGNALYSCKSGSSYLDPHHEFQIHDDGYAPVGWTVSEWLDEFPREDVETFVRIAKQAGVEVGDQLQRAMEIEDAYEVEVEQCRIYSRTEEGRARIAEAGANRNESDSESDDE